MALSKVGSGESYDNGGSTWGTPPSANLTYDTGTASGDLILLAIHWYETGDDDFGLDAISGFVDQGSIVVGGTGNTEVRFDLYTRVANGSESGDIAIGRTDNSFFGTAQILTLRGSSALSFVSATGGTPGGGVTSIDAPSVSITSTQGIVAAFTLEDPPGAAYTDPSGMTLGISEASDQTTTGRMYYESPAAGATGTRTLAWAGGSSRDALGVTIIVEGANAGGGSVVPLMMSHYQ